MTLFLRYSLCAAVFLTLPMTACEKGEATQAKTSPAIRGQVRLSLEHQRTLKETAALYIIARKPGEIAGPPLAVKRFGPPLKFPLDFSISASDIMMPGQKFEGSLALTARVSQSGAAMPRTPGDIEGFPTEPFVPVGAENVGVELNQVRR